MTTEPPREEVEAFLNETEFSGYQSVPLPHGLRVPGTDKTPAVDFYLADRVASKSVIDIGTYYGLYPCEAMRRGAVRAVGIERDPQRYAIANRIAELNGSTYEIHCAGLEEFVSKDTFDVVLFLNVLHHVLDPIEAVKKAASLSHDLLLVEFCLPWDYSMLVGLGSGKRSLFQKVATRLRSRLVHAVCRNLPVMAVGNREYHRTFYFSPKAFRNAFVIHHKLFKSIDFVPSPRKRHRAVAICRVA